MAHEHSIHYSLGVGDEQSKDKIERLLDSEIAKARSEGNTTKAAAIELQKAIFRPWLDWLQANHKDFEAIGLSIPNALGALIAQTAITFCPDDSGLKFRQESALRLIENVGRIAMQCLEAEERGEGMRLDLNNLGLN